MFTESGRKTQFGATYNMRLRGFYFLTLISVLFAPMTLIAAVGFQKKPCRILPFYSYNRRKQNTLYCSHTNWAWSVCIVILSIGPLGQWLIVALIYTNICWIQQNFLHESAHMYKPKLPIYKNWIVYVQYEHGWIHLLKPQALFVVVVLISYHYNTEE